MRIGCFSDLHLDWVTRGRSRFDDISQAVDRTIQEVIKRKVDRFFFLGDLCDPDRNLTTTRAVTCVMEAAVELSQAGIPSHWLAGNHDVIEDGSGATMLRPFRALPYGRASIWLHEEPILMSAFGAEDDPNPVGLLALPFTATSHPYDPEALAQEALAIDNPLIVISHLAVAGVQPGEETKEMPRGREVLLPRETLQKRKAPTLILQGHYHRRQVFEGVHICGSLARLTFGEEDNNPGFLIVEW